MTAALGALLVPAVVGTAAADAAKRHKKYPVVTSVRPMNVAIGETLEIRGKNFLRGRDKNTVVFKRDGARAVFVKAPVGTARLLRLRVPDKLQEFFGLREGVPVQTRFRLRILSRRFAKKFTSDSRSPVVVPPRPPSTTPPVALPDGDCDGDGQLNRNDRDDDNDALDDGTEVSLGLDPCQPDTDEDGVADRFEFDCDQNGVLNRDQADDDSDLLDDQLETRIGTDPCVLDTDGDGVEDGYEYQSAIDLNDDEYQEPNISLPYPGRRPYPNPLFADAGVDYDGDVLTLAEEQSLWKYTYSITRSDPRSLSALSYSDGLQSSRYSRSADGRRHPALPAVGYDKQAAFVSWASSFGYRQTLLEDGTYWDERRAGCDFTGPNFYKLFDVNRDCLEHGSNTPASGEPTTYVNEVIYYDYYPENGFLSDNERDEDGDGLTNYDESHGRMTPAYWAGCYVAEKPYYVSYAGTAIDNADSDGDGVLDGADDQDHDDIPNHMELSRYAASGLVDFVVDKPCIPLKDLDPLVPRHERSYGRVNPFNPCLPNRDSRTCPLHPNADTGAPFGGAPNWWSLQ